MSVYREQNKDKIIEELQKEVAELKQKDEQLISIRDYIINKIKKHIEDLYKE